MTYMGINVNHYTNFVTMRKKKDLVVSTLALSLMHKEVFLKYSPIVFAPTANTVSCQVSEMLASSKHNSKFKHTAGHSLQFLTEAEKKKLHCVWVQDT